MNQVTTPGPELKLLLAVQKAEKVVQRIRDSVVESLSEDEQSRLVAEMISAEEMVSDIYNEITSRA